MSSFADEVDASIRAGNLEAAQGLLDTLEPSRKWDEDVSFWRGQILHRRGQLEQALQALNLSVALNKTNTEAWREIGYINYWLDRDDDAQAALHTALDLDQGLQFIRYHLAHIERKHGRWDEAIRLYQSELEVNPGFSPSVFFRGVVAARSGDIERARVDFCAVSADPDLSARIEDGRLRWPLLPSADTAAKIDAAAAADELVYHVGLGRMLLLGATGVGIARVLLRRGLDVVSICQASPLVADAAALAPGRFFVAPFDQIPFESQSFSTVVVFAGDRPISDGDGFDRLVRECARLARRWVVVEAKAEGSPDDAITSLWRNVTARRGLRVNPAIALKALRCGPQSAAFVFEHATDEQRGFEGSVSEANVLFPASKQAREMHRLALALNRLVPPLRYGIGAVHWRDAATYHAGAILGALTPRALFHICVPDDEIEQAKVLYENAFKDTIFVARGEPGPGDAGDGRCTLVSFEEASALEGAALGDALIVKVEPARGSHAHAWLRGHGFTLRCGLRLDRRDADLEFVEFPCRRMPTTRRLAEMWNGGETLFLVATRHDFVERLASADWRAFEADFGNMAKRPPLMIEELAVLAGRLTDAISKDPADLDAVFRASLATLGFAYGLLADPSATWDESGEALALLARCAAAIAPHRASDEACRWHMSLFRAAAMLNLNRGDRESALADFERCIALDDDKIRPHLRKHPLDALFLGGIINFADGATAEAMRRWTLGADRLRSMTAAIASQNYDREFEFNETAHLFAIGSLNFGAAALVDNRRSADEPFDPPLGIANGCVIAPFDRYGDAAVAGPATGRVLDV